MSIKKDLLKAAQEIRKEGISVSSVKSLYKKASDIRIAYLIANIRK